MKSSRPVPGLARALQVALAVLRTLVLGAALLLGAASCAGSGSTTSVTAYVAPTSSITSAPAPSVSHTTHTHATYPAATTTDGKNAASTSSTSPDTSSSTAGVTTSDSVKGTTTTAGSRAPLDFDAAGALTHIQALGGQIGVREAGTDGETVAVGYAVDYLTGLGYEPTVNEVPLPNGRVSHNVIVVKPGTSQYTIIVGAHIDSKAPSPGANDNASGVAVVLELARDFVGATTVPTIELVLFGCEEMIDANENHHHYGSRTYVATLSGDRSKALAGMISVDMIAFGDTFAYRTMGKGPQLLSNMIGGYSGKHGTKMSYQRDPGPYGWSDHEAFELAGYPAVWIERVSDPAHHTTSDIPSRCKQTYVRQTGDLLLGFLTSLGESDLKALASASAR